MSFTIILLIEDKFFRRRDGYVLTAWNQPENLPPGIAAVFALLCGYLCGGVPGMSQTWYIGVSDLDPFSSYSSLADDLCSRLHCCSDRTEAMSACT